MRSPGKENIERRESLGSWEEGLSWEELWYPVIWCRRRSPQRKLRNIVQKGSWSVRKQPQKPEEESLPKRKEWSTVSKGG